MSMKLRKRDVREMEPKSEICAGPPVWEHNDCISGSSATLLLSAVQDLSEAVWRASAGRDHYLHNSGVQWIDLKVSGDTVVLVPGYLSGVRVELLAAISQLLALTECHRIGRVFISRYAPHSGKGAVRQFSLAPHVDSGKMTSSLSLRPAGSQGGLLAVSTAVDGCFPRKGNRDVIDSRYGSIRHYHQGHGSVLTVHGSEVEHFVTTTVKAARYALVVFGV